MWTRLQTLMYLKKKKIFYAVATGTEKAIWPKSGHFFSGHDISGAADALLYGYGAGRHATECQKGRLSWEVLQGTACWGTCTVNTHTQIRLREVCLLRYKLGSRGFEPKSQFSQLLSFTLLSPRGTSRMSSPLDEVKYQSPYLNLPRDSTAEDNAVLLISHHS